MKVSPSLEWKKRRERARRTITRDDEELLLSGRLVDDDIRVDGDDLVLSIEGVVLLELEVSNSSREGEVSCQKNEEGSENGELSLSNGLRKVKENERGEPFTRPNSTNPPAAVIRAFSSVESKRRNGELASSSGGDDAQREEGREVEGRTLVHRLVVVTQGNLLSSNRDDGPRVSSIGLSRSKQRRRSA